MVFQFAKKILYFSIPLLIFFLVPVSYLYISGENYRNLDVIVRDYNNYLIGYAYNQDNYRYLKFREIQARDSVQVMALGSSRVLQFRKEMFTTSFYNAGYTLSRISEFESRLKTISKFNKPQVIIISLDQWMFNSKWDSGKSESTDLIIWNPVFQKYATIQTLLNVWKDVFIGKYDYEMIFSKIYDDTLYSHYGLNAFANNTGVRKDGSYNYGVQVDKLLNNDSTAYDFNYLETLQRIDKGTDRFQFSNSVNPTAISSLNSLLVYCRDNNINVVAVIPPFANTVMQQLKRSGMHDYIDKIFNEINPIFVLHGFELWDMTDLQDYGSKDDEVVDGFHGGELSYLKMLIHMSENGSILKNHTDTAFMRTSIENKVNRYVVYQ